MDTNDDHPDSQEINIRITQLGSVAHNKLVEKDLADIASMIIYPFTLAPYLDINSAQLETLKRNYPNHDVLKFQMLCSWQRRVGSKATLYNLVTILRKQNQVNLAEEILDHFIKKLALQSQSETIPTQSPQEISSTDQEDTSDANDTDGPLRGDPTQHQLLPPQPQATPHQQQQQGIGLASSEPLADKFTADDLEKKFSIKLNEVETNDDKSIRESSKVLIEVVNDTEFKTAICQMEGKIYRQSIIDEFTGSTSTYFFGYWKEVPVIVTKTAKRSGTHYQYGSWFATKKALYYFKKLEYIFGVGVCGAIRDKNTKRPRVPHCHVVISSHIIGYDHQKIMDGGRQVNRSFSENLTEFDFYDYINNPGNQKGWSRKIHFGEVLSGSWLVASLAAQDFIANPDTDDKLAVEMEGVGIAAACKSTKIKAYLVIKGVSDYADGTKNDDYQPSAARNAALFLTDMLNMYPHINGPKEKEN